MKANADRWHPLVTAKRLVSVNSDEFVKYWNEGKLLSIKKDYQAFFWKSCFISLQKG